jgi:hypothetical protein
MPLDAGRPAEAEAFCLRLLPMWQRNAGDEAPGTLETLRTLGRALHAQERLADADPLRSRTLEFRRRRLGDQDADTLDSLNDIRARSKPAALC